MPILWRYLLSQYVKVLTLSVITFLAVLLTTRLEEIAKFASLGAEARYIFFFAMYQIPYILPIVIPISCLISSIILFQQLCQSNELTALRSSGFRLTQIITPVLFAGAIITLANFYIVSEWATQSHLATRQLQTEIKSINPLVVLQNTPFLKMKGIYASSDGKKKSSDSTSNLLVVTKNHHQDRLFLLTANQVESKNGQIIATDVTTIGNSDGGKDQEFDHLFIENMDKMTIPLDDFTQLIRGEGWKLSIDHLNLPLLLIKTQESWDNTREFNKCISEIVRRFSVAGSAFALTLLGASFGIAVGRRASLRGTSYVVGLTVLYLACFFGAKSVDYQLALSASLYIVPLILILLLSFWNLNRISRGLES